MPFAPRLFLPSLASCSDETVLNDQLSHYLVKVLRLREGDKFWGFDGKGLERELTLKKADPGQARVGVGQSTERSSAPPPASITLAQGLPKGPKMDLILRQGTEAGVHRFIPLVTQRSVSRPEVSQYRHKNERWQKILVEACRQCGRADIPELDSVTSWEDALEIFTQFDLVLLPYEKEAPTLWTVLESGPPARKILVLVGPEGGWAEEELLQAREAGANPTHLPTPILRTETAGLAVVSMIQFFLSAVGKKGE